METVKQIIPAFNINECSSELIASNRTLDVAEFFCDTIQGEGIHAGHPAAFLRLKGCTLNCKWCDTMEVWRHGDTYGFHQLFAMMEEFDLIEKFKNGHHLVVTGGSPLRQQYNLVSFFHDFYLMYKFLPFVEIENECMIRPTAEMIDIVSCWNNSPKLSNSGNTTNFLKPNILTEMNLIDNSWFKFVVGDLDDWKEIAQLIGLIDKRKIIVMPLGATREELELTRPIAIRIATEQGVKYSDRLHVVAWDKKTGV